MLENTKEIAVSGERGKDIKKSNMVNVKKINLYIYMSMYITFIKNLINYRFTSIFLSKP